jgi:hypothetical protein
MPHQRKTNKRRMRRNRHRHTRKTSSGGTYPWDIQFSKLFTGRKTQSRKSNFLRNFGQTIYPLPPKPAPTPITESGPVYDNRYPIEEYRKQLELYKNKKHHNKNRK